jgi:hypothetical protein
MQRKIVGQVMPSLYVRSPAGLYASQLVERPLAHIVTASRNTDPHTLSPHAYLY